MQVCGWVRRLNPFIRSLSRGLVLIAILAQTDATFAQSASPTIKRFETFRTTLLGGRPSVMAAGTTVQRLQLPAFGQTFRLRVQPNSSLSGISSDPELRLLHGTIADKPTSWVRLSYRGSEVQGLIWDGRDLYAVEPASAVAGLVTASAQLPAQGSIIFRLADAEVALAADFCGASPGEASASDGMTAYQDMVDELDRMQIAAAGSALNGIELSLLADAAFRAQYASSTDAENAILTRLNNLDGIFSGQLGIHLLAASVAVYGGDSLSASKVAGTLLDSLATLRSADAALRVTGLTHLFTGRNLDGNTVGMAYVDTVCHSRYAVGLTESRSIGAWLESLVAAHEIGHNLGAVHDGEGSCSETPLTYLMAPQINGSSAFSACSLNKFATTLSTATCTVPLAGANPQLPADLGTTMAAPATIFDWAVEVGNAGDLEASGVQVSLRFPEGVTVNEHWTEGGTCASTAGDVTCSLGRLKAGETRSVNMRLSADEAATYVVTAAMGADNDSEPADNTASGTIAIRQSADVGATFDPAQTVEANTDATLGFRLTNAGPSAAGNVMLKLTYPADVLVSAVEFAGASCAPGTLQTSCTLPALAPGTNIEGQMHFRITTTGTKSLQMDAHSDNYDPAPGNNSAALDLPVAAAGTAGPAKASAGGGGVFDWMLLATLFALSMRPHKSALSGRTRPQANA